MINYIDYFIPPGRVSVETVFDAQPPGAALHPTFETAEDGITFFKYVLDVHAVAVAEVLDESLLVRPLLESFFAAGLTTPAQISLILLIGDELNKGSRMDNFGHYLQYAYQMEAAEVLVLSGNHCSNAEFALAFGESLLKSGDVENILVIAVNKLVQHEERLIGSYGIQGDGAGIMFLSRDTQQGIKLLGKYTVTTGVMHTADVNAASSLLLLKNYISCLSGLLQKYTIDPSAIDAVVVQNANPGLVMKSLQSVGIKPAQVFTDNLTAYGHLDCVDFLVNLKTVAAQEAGAGKKIISFGTGWAGSQIALYLETF